MLTLNPSLLPPYLLPLFPSSSRENTGSSQNKNSTYRATKHQCQDQGLAHYRNPRLYTYPRTQVTREGRREETDTTQARMALISPSLHPTAFLIAVPEQLCLHWKPFLGLCQGRTWPLVRHSLGKDHPQRGYCSLEPMLTSFTLSFSWVGWFYTHTCLEVTMRGKLI